LTSMDEAVIVKPVQVTASAPAVIGGGEQMV
jgi:hypothetical protein